MSDQAFDPRFESLLREALTAEAATLPVTIEPAQILERGRARRSTSAGARLRRPRLSRMVAATAAVVLVAVATVVLSTLPRRSDLPVASLPTSSADWSRVGIELPPGIGGIRHIAASPRGLVAVTAFDDSGNSRVLFSTDGRDWSMTDVSPVRGEYVSVVATDRGFLLTVSEDGAWASENGLEWQHVADNWSGDPDVGGAIVVDAAAGGPGYVAVGNHNKVWFSTDGSEWALAEVPPPPADLIRSEFPDLTVDILQVEAVDDHFVATGTYVAENGDASIDRDFVLASSDGRIWSTVLPDIGDRAGPLEIAAGPDGFLLIGGPLDGEDAWSIWQSADGEAWQLLGSHGFGSRSPDEVRIDDVAATNSGYVAVGLARECFGCTSQALLWTSPDGRSWSSLEGGDPFNLREPGTSLSSVAVFGSRFVVGGQHDGRPAIWISGSERPDATAAADATATPGATASPMTASPNASLSSTEPSADLGIFEPLVGRIVSSTGSSVFGVDPNAPSLGSTVRVDLAGAGGSMEPLGWSSDGTELLLLRSVPHFPGSRQPPFDEYLYILHADGTETQVTPDPDVGGGAISPDGSLVAFFVGPPFHLFVVDPGGGEPIRIADGLSPTFSPDGSQIAYVVLNTGGAHVWVANADGSDAHEILADEPALIEGVFDLAWSPTGDRIAMGNSLERHEAIYTFAPDGSDFTKVITGGSSPFWSPDGSQIAYTLPHGYTTDDGEPIGEQSSRLAIANADGSNVREFDFGESGPWHPGTLR